jgi:YihY family inner membrane protein
MKRIVQWLDRLQKRRRTMSVAVATFKKFSEDRSSNLAAMIAFWAFFSIFPLLLVLVTVLGWVLSAGSKASVLTRIAGMFPLLDPKSVTGLTGSTWALILGALTALWSGLGVVRTTQFAFDSVWEVAYNERIGMLKQIGRSLWVLATIGAGLVLTTLISGLVTSTSNGLDLGVAGRAGGYLIAIVLDVVLVVAAFRILTSRDVTLRDVLPGGVVAGVAFFILQEASSIIISNRLKNAQATYGHFATVIVILWWFYLQALITLLAAQLNVVLRDRLYPRSLVDGPQTDADHRVLQAYAGERTYEEGETVAADVERTR